MIGFGHSKSSDTIYTLTADEIEKDIGTYVKLITAGRKTINDVPILLQNMVLERLEDMEDCHNGINA